jgi:hypothetical protein
LAGLALSFLASCSSSVDMPKGTAKGHHSARLINPGGMVKPAPDFLPELPKVNRMVQKALAQDFKAHGMSVGSPGSDLVVGYLLIVQNNGATTAFDDYFGYGRSVDAIVDEAHKRGVLSKNPRPDAFVTGAIVVDVLDAKTNKLIYRNFAKRDIARNISDSARQQRINQTVQEALAPFFK